MLIPMIGAGTVIVGGGIGAKIHTNKKIKKLNQQIEEQKVAMNYLYNQQKKAEAVTIGTATALGSLVIGEAISILSLNNKLKNSVAGIRSDIISLNNTTNENTKKLSCLTDLYSPDDKENVKRCLESYETINKSVSALGTDVVNMNKTMESNNTAIRQAFEGITSSMATKEDLAKINEEIKKK